MENAQVQVKYYAGDEFSFKPVARVGLSFGEIYQQDLPNPTLGKNITCKLNALNIEAMDITFSDLNIL